MANALKENDTVYVPCSAFIELERHDTALYKTQVASVNKSSVSVKLPGGVISEYIGTSRVHSDVGILLIEIGDFESEAATLDPLAKSVLQFCRLLVPDDQLRSVKVRSLIELKKFWDQNHGAYSHVILIGHGDRSSLMFAVDGDVPVPNLAATFNVKKAKPKLFISLACETGYQSFGGEFSKEPICKDLLGPFHSVHGAVASQFCQTFLTSHFLDGRTTKVAFNHARACVPGGISFRLWHNGNMHTT
jgi:hypothetical protein